MTSAELNSRYRNLLIILARDAQALKQQVECIGLDVPTEPHHDKRNGLRSIINARNRQRARLMVVLARNNASLRHFFGVTDPAIVANQKIEIDSVTVATHTADAPSHHNTT